MNILKTRLLTLRTEFSSLPKPRKDIILLLLSFVVIGLASNLYIFLQTSSSPVLPPPILFSQYTLPTIQPSDAYTIIFLGDSMTAALGPNTDKLREYLKITHPNKTFGIFNHAAPSTNILSAPKLLTEDFNQNGTPYPAITKRKFDLIFIESFAYNPLSQYPLPTGLMLQTKALHSLVKTLNSLEYKPIIVFITPIAPNSEKFSSISRDLTPEIRRQWVEERRAYIQNHVHYATLHSIPVLDIYSKTLKDGDGDLTYIDPYDYIHPSQEGVDLISREIANFISQNHLLPN